MEPTLSYFPKRFAVIKRKPKIGAPWSKKAITKNPRPKPKKRVRRANKRQIRVFKQVIWKTPTADSKFSHAVRERDGGRCRRCKTDKDLTCSHFWERGMKGTRFLMDNCITLCTPCHAEWEHLKNQDYKDFMLEWLGRKRYDEVEKIARTFKKMRDAVAEAMEWLK